MSNPILISTDVQINRTAVLNICKDFVNQIIANIPNKTLRKMICLPSTIVDSGIFRSYLLETMTNVIKFCYNSHNNPEITDYLCSLVKHDPKKNKPKIFIINNDNDIPVVNGNTYILIFHDNYDQYKPISEIIIEKDKKIFFYNVYTNKIVYNEKGWKYVTEQ